MPRWGRGYPVAAAMTRAKSPGDPLWTSVVALLHFDGSNGGTTFTDSSLLASNFGNNASSLSTTQQKFGATSWKSSGASSLAQATAANSNFTFGTGDFTIEMWLYPTLTTQTSVIYDSRPASTNGLYPCIQMSSGVLIYFVNNATVITDSGALSLNTWHHIAVSRVSGSARMFVDGTQVGSTFTDSNNYLGGGSGKPRIGNSNAATASFSTYIDEARITKAGRYSSNFTAPTSPFPQG